MHEDNIVEIGIDETGRLYIKPEVEKFTEIYRTGTEVHWDNIGLFLYSPKPREWSYLDWYKHITHVTQTECNCRLITTPSTQWINIPETLRADILMLGK